MKTLLLYHSKTGHTFEATKAIAEGIRLAGSNATIISVTSFEAETIHDYDGVIVASPCWAGSVTGSGIAKPLATFLANLPAGSFQGKRCGAISIHSTAGGGNTLKALGEILLEKGCTDYRPGPVAKAGVPFSLWRGPAVSTQDQEHYKEYGAQFVA